MFNPNMSPTADRAAWAESAEMTLPAPACSAKPVRWLGPRRLSFDPGEPGAYRGMLKRYKLDPADLAIPKEQDREVL